MSDDVMPPAMAQVTPETVTAIGWVIPRPTGRWHQSILVTGRHVWLTPELPFSENEALLAAAAAGIGPLHDHIRVAGWITRPPRCDLTDVRGVNWNETTGWIRIAAAETDVIGAMIPDRTVGAKVEQAVRQAIVVRVKRPTNGS